MNHPTRRTLMTTAALAGLASAFGTPKAIAADVATPKQGGTLTSLLTPGAADPDPRRQQSKPDPDRHLQNLSEPA